MPKIYGGPGPRTIHPSMRTSQSLAGCSVGAQLLFDRLIVAADDQGRLLGDLVLLKAETLPRMKTLTLAQLDRWLQELIAEKMVIWYEIQGETLLQLANWWDAQAGLRRAYPSRWPAPPGWRDRVFGHGSEQSRIEEAVNLRAERGQDAGSSPAVSAQSAPSRAPAEPNLTEPNPPRPRERARASGDGSDDQTDGFQGIRKPLTELLDQQRNGKREATPTASDATTPARAATAAAVQERDPDE